MITLTDYDGFAATYQDDCFITVTPYSQGGVAGSKIEYLTNTYTIAVAYVISTPATISGSSVYVQPLTIVLDNGQTETFYLNPRFYKSYTAVGSNTQLIYEYDQASQPQSYITSTSTGTIDAQIAAATGGGGSGWGLSGNAGTNAFTNYIGTSDAQPLSIKANDVRQIALDGVGNVFNFSTTDIGNQGDNYVSIRATDINTFILQSVASGLERSSIFFDDKLTLSTNNAAQLTVDATGEVGIGTATPAAILDVTSTTSAFLPPRMTGTQRDAIVAPVNGMILYNTTTDKLQVRAAGAWVDLH
jgi:hypothetical protein